MLKMLLLPDLQLELALRQKAGQVQRGQVLASCPPLRNLGARLCDLRACGRHLLLNCGPHVGEHLESRPGGLGGVEEQLGDAFLPAKFLPLMDE